MRYQLIEYMAKYTINPGGMDEITLKLPPKDVPDELRWEIIDDYKHLIESVASRQGVIYKFQDSNSNKEKSALLLIRNVSDLFRHKRIFRGTMARWPGTWGAFLIEILRRDCSGRAIYCEGDNSNSFSEEASDMMNSLGFKVSARTLYLRYSSIRENELQDIYIYNRALTNSPYTPEWDGKNNYYINVLNQKY